MLDLFRLRRALPLPNALDGDRLALPWHRALDQAVRYGAGRSWRGGGHRTFFVSLGENLQLDTLTTNPGQGRPVVKQFTVCDPVAKWTCAQAWHRASAHNAKRFLSKLQAEPSDRTKPPTAPHYLPSLTAQEAHASHMS